MLQTINNFIIKPTLRQIARMLPEEIMREINYVQGHGARHIHTLWNIRGVDRNGNVLWSEEMVHNIFHDEGEEWLLQVGFSEVQSVPVSFYIGLDDRAALAEADTLPPANEPSGNGYARQAVASDATDWTVSQDSGDFQAKSKTVTFTASGGSIPAAGVVDNMFLATTIDDTGKIIASAGLSASRTILDGDSLQTDLTVKLSE